MEVQSRDDNEKSFKQLEGISFDSDKTESATTNASLKKAGALAWGSPAEGGLGTGSAPGGMRPMGGDMAPASQPAEISLLAPEKNTKHSQFLDFTNLFK